MPESNTKSPRKGARSRADIPPETLVELNAGRIEAATLAECLAVEQATLMRAVLPGFPSEAVAELDALAAAGITRRMAAAAAILLANSDESVLERLRTHPSDTVRGWSAFAIGAMPGIALSERLELIRVHADDPHFGVREWAWMAVRQHLASDIASAIALLQPWTAEKSPNLRRFAVEAIRPRGVWAAHIGALKAEPDLGLPILEPLKADPSLYVQDAVANWINDAAKSQPAWAGELRTRWLAGTPSPITARIIKRGLRSL